MKPQTEYFSLCRTPKVCYSRGETAMANVCPKTHVSRWPSPASKLKFHDNPLNQEQIPECFCLRRRCVLAHSTLKKKHPSMVRLVRMLSMTVFPVMTMSMMMLIVVLNPPGV